LVLLAIIPFGLFENAKNRVLLEEKLNKTSKKYGKLFTEK
jgi:hypothetical protein